MKNTEFYNYAYLDLTKKRRIVTPTICFLFEPLYVGKGKGSRYQHGRIAIEEGKQLLTNKLLYADLKRLLRAGHDPEILKFNEESSNENSLLAEASIIEALGRRGIEQGGILCNRALGGEVPDTTGLPAPMRGKKVKDHLSPERYELYRHKITQPKTAEAIQKMVKARKENGTYQTGSQHPRAKTFVMISPAGQEFIVTGALKSFCSEKNLSWQLVYKNLDKGRIENCSSKYQNVNRQSEKFLNTLGWECRRL